MSYTRLEPPLSTALSRSSEALNSKVEEVLPRRSRLLSHGDCDLLRKTERAIDDMGSRFRAFRKATDLECLGGMFVAEARLAGAKTCEIARHMGECVYNVVSHSALPSWMRDNEYIHFHYRPQLNSVSSCFRSIFRLHTETGNIWTHLVGCVVFLVLGLSYLTQEGLSFAREVDLTWQDRLMFGTFFVSAVACLLFSTLFHTMCCHSPSVSNVFARLDYCGIALLIMGSATPWYYYAFYCEIVAMLRYVVGMLFLGAICIIVTLSERFSDSRYRTMRATVFITFALCGLVPAADLLLTHGPAAAFSRNAGDKLLLMGALYLTGALFYAARIPERFLPGRFDLFCHSHQIFHVFVVAGAFVTLHGIHEAALNALSMARCMEIPAASDALDD